MLIQLGAWGRVRYLNQSDHPSATAYLNNLTTYNPNQIVQRSTDVSRALQSAAAFVQGLFDSSRSSFYPAISTVPLDTDSMLNADAIPASKVFHEVRKHEEEKHFNDNYLLSTFNASTWAALGAEVQLSACVADGITNFFQCFRETYDVAEAYYSMGLLGTPTSPPRFPLLSQHYRTLQQLTRQYHELYLAWHPEEHTDAHRGPLGRNVVDEILAQFSAFQDGTQVAQLREYSTEDTTICVLADTLGASADDQLPAFGAAWWFELMLDDHNAGYWMRILHGAPEQLPGKHHYSMRYFNMTCMSSSGVLYYATEEGCPVSDFEAFYATRVGSSSEGYCYVRPDVLAAIKCDKVDEHPDSLCAWYRQMCPEYACPTDSYLKIPSYKCKSL